MRTPAQEHIACGAQGGQPNWSHETNSRSNNLGNKEARIRFGALHKIFEARQTTCKPS
jgi:hypothetical protein